MTDLRDILNHEDDVTNDEMLRYLQGEASEEERFAIEKRMADSSFVDEAVEGLQQFKDPGQVQEYVNQLNRQLRKHTDRKMVRKQKRKLKDNNWLIIAILGILLLCVFGYLVIHFYSVKH